MIASMIESHLTVRLQLPLDGTGFGTSWSVTDGDSVGGGAIRSLPWCPSRKRAYVHCCICRYQVTFLGVTSLPVCLETPDLPEPSIVQPASQWATAYIFDHGHSQRR